MLHQQEVTDTSVGAVTRNYGHGDKCSKGKTKQKHPVLFTTGSAVRRHYNKTDVMIHSCSGTKSQLKQPLTEGGIVERCVFAND